MRDGNIVACKPDLEQFYTLYVLMHGSHTVNLSIPYVDTSLFARFWDQILPFLMGYVRTGPGSEDQGIKALQINTEKRFRPDRAGWTYYPMSGVDTGVRNLTFY